MNRIEIETRTLTVSELLSSVYLPSFQRIEHLEHVDTILRGLSSYYDEHKEIFLPGVISLGKVPTRERYILYDGQHRLRALERFHQSVGDLSDYGVRVDVYHLSNEQDGKRLYEILNTSKKVDLYDGDLAPHVIPRLQQFMKDAFGEHCKTSKQPRGVNINLDELGRRVHAYAVLERIPDLTIDNLDSQLFMRVVRWNTFCGQHIDWLRRMVDEFDDKYEKFVKPAKHPFYLGLWRNYEWIDWLADEPSERDVSSVIHQRQKLSKALREEVWRKRNGDRLTGECYVCSRSLKFNSFHCGHIVPVKEGGNNDLANLEPVCAVCNLDMGCMNLDAYKALFV